MESTQDSDQLRHGSGSVSYGDRMKAHLSRYKEDVLAIRESGTWRGKTYAHILPDYRHNILEAYRTRFWQYKLEKKLPLHPCISHLTSSQAMCFNLLFPFVDSVGLGIQAFLRTLGEDAIDIADYDFEVLMDKEESTEFDFCIRTDSGRKLFFEFKLTESVFGRATLDDRHREKYKTIYLPKFGNKFQTEATEMQFFLKHYQLMRNIWYLNPDQNDRFFVVLPKANEQLRKGKAVIQRIASPTTASLIKVIYLEDLVSALRQQCSELSDHFDAFGKKYFLPG